MSRIESIQVTDMKNIWEENDKAINEIREINDKFYRENGRQKKVLTKTYGCQMY
jgi:hypothetical protein